MLSCFSLCLIVLGLALHFPGWLWHDIYHSHEGLETLWTQAGFYVATAIVLAGALAGLLQTDGTPMRLSYATVLAGALVETGGWVWDFAAHYAGGSSQAAHTVVFVGAAIVALGVLAVVTLARTRLHSEEVGDRKTGHPHDPIFTKKMGHR